MKKYILKINKFFLFKLVQLKVKFFSCIKFFKRFYINNLYLIFYKSNEEVYPLFSREQRMHCKISHSFSIPGDRVKDYLKNYIIKKQNYTVAKKAILFGPNLIGLDSNLMPIIATFPHKYFFKNSEIRKLRHIYKESEKIDLDFNVCPLFFKLEKLLQLFLVYY